MAELIAILSDVHAYAEPLARALEEIQKECISQIYFLGDITQGGGQESECVKLLQNHRVNSVAGNHCRQSKNWNTENAEVKKYLKNLEMVINVGDLCFSHENPLKECKTRYGREPFAKDGGIRDENQAKYVFEKALSEFPATRLFFVGHTHEPVVWQFCLGDVKKLQADKEVQLIDRNKYIVNPGAIAGPHVPVAKRGEHRTWNASFVFYDSAHDKLLFRSVPAQSSGKA